MIIELSNISKNVVSEIERQPREGKVFNQIGSDGKQIKTFFDGLQSRHERIGDLYGTAFGN